MNEQQFNKMYNTAIEKIAVGFHILEVCGKDLGYDLETIETNKEQLCMIFSEGIQIRAGTIYLDSLEAYNRMDEGYINQLQHSGLLEELVDNMQSTLAQNNNCKLGYNALDN